MRGAGPLLTVDNASMRFCRDTARSLRYGVADLARAMLPFLPQSRSLRPGEFWSLDGVSFQVQPGEALAIGGRNGAGKTTLLRMLARLLQPDGGAITLNGSVNSVIELGQGLNPALTGRENAEIGLAWRGLTRRKMETLVPEVEAFAALGAMFDAPVHSYSAGMRVRLAFAIAVSIPCDLLLLDEVLAVGDLAFQQKCIEHMQRHLQRGGALILVSHNPVQMQALCRRGILLEQGRLVFDGAIEQCIDRMFELQTLDRDQMDGDAGPDARVHIDSVQVVSETPSDRIMRGDTLVVEITFSVSEPVRAGCSFSIHTRDLSVCIAAFGDPRTGFLASGTHVRRCRIPDLPLAHGAYAVRVAIFHPETYIGHAQLGYSSAPVEFHVEEALSRGSLLTRHTGQLVWIAHDWQGHVSEADDAASERQRVA
jgi:lipopolysaccharide transport system ATP-binding protein